MKRSLLLSLLVLASCHSVEQPRGSLQSDGVLRVQIDNEGKLKIPGWFVSDKDLPELVKQGQYKSAVISPASDTANFENFGQALKVEQELKDAGIPDVRILQ